MKTDDLVLSAKAEWRDAVGRPKDQTRGIVILRRIGSVAVALMLLFVLKVTGIPPTEEQALKSRGDDYRDYQRTTNAFFPGPRRARPQERPEPS